MKVLLAPLDWGLGHATRCIPLITSMLEKGWHVTVAGEGPSLALLKEEFPELEFLHLKGYRVNYPRSRTWFTLWMVAQTPKLAWVIAQEQRWLKRLMKQRTFDLIISDNRYGLYHSTVPSVILTHQLRIYTGWGTLADQVVNAFTNRYIRRFQQCWIPDVEQGLGIAGRLSHPEQLPSNARYIGPLSRLHPFALPSSDQIVITLSGPEPQRTLLEERIIAQARELPYRFLIVRGLPQKDVLLPPQSRIRFINHLNAHELAREIAISQMVICRSGYSSVMDLIRMGKKAVLIPTPGQTEQELIAQHVFQKGWFLTQEQSAFNLSTAITDCLSSTCAPPFLNYADYQKVLDEFSTQ